jgi:acid phosphatase class B
MRPIICLTAAAILFAGSTPVLAKAAKPAPFQIDTTSWLFTEKGTRTRMSVDADGNYITQSVAGKHLDHGTAVVKDDKVCFTSKMTKEGEVCWTTHPVKVGHSMKTVSDKGEKLTVTRVKYTPLSMPK